MLVCELSFFKQYFFSRHSRKQVFYFYLGASKCYNSAEFFPIGFQLSQVDEFWPKKRFDQRRGIGLSSNQRLFVSQWQALLTVPLSLEDQCVHSKYKANEIIWHFLLTYKFSTLNWVSTLNISSVSSVVGPLKNSDILSIYSLVFCCCVLRSTASPLNSNFLILADWCSAWKWFFLLIGNAAILAAKVLPNLLYACRFDCEVSY